MKAGTCRYFTGVQHDHCDAGIAYAQFRESSHDIPCIKKYARGTPSANPGQCDKYTEPSDEEIAKSKAEMEAAMKRFTAALPLIAKVKKEHKGESWKGVEVCPVCNGRLHMSHAAFNGHVWGQCETKGCLSWME